MEPNGVMAISRPLREYGMEYSYPETPVPSSREREVSI